MFEQSELSQWEQSVEYALLCAEAERTFPEPKPCSCLKNGTEFQGCTSPLCEFS